VKGIAAPVLLEEFDSILEKESRQKHHPLERTIYASEASNPSKVLYRIQMQQLADSQSFLVAGAGQPITVF